MTRERIVTTLPNADALQYFLSNDLDSRYDYKGLSASRRVKVLETLADGGGFTVITEQYTTGYIDSRIEQYINLLQTVDTYYEFQYDKEKAEHEAREAERKSQALKDWNSRSIGRKFSDSMYGLGFYFYSTPYRTPYRVDYAIDTVSHIAAELDLKRSVKTPVD